VPRDSFFANISFTYVRCTRLLIESSLCRKRLVCFQPILCIEFMVELAFKELNHLAAILHVFTGGVDFYEVKKILLFFKKKREILLQFTLLIIFIVKNLKKEQNHTNLQLYSSICRNKRAITPK
jgi:hypothetical protein